MSDQPTFRLYIGSLMALRREPSESGKELIRWLHIPSLYFAGSMKSACKQAELELLNEWPVEDGYFDHEATIEAAPLTLYGAIESYTAQGVFSTAPDPSESLTRLHLDPGIYVTELDDDIIGDKE